MALSNYDYMRIAHTLFNLTHAYETGMDMDADISESGLGIQDLAVLIILGQRAPITSRQLAAMMEISPGMVSIYVQRLVEKDLVCKEQDRDDRRNWWLSLTEDGQHMYKAIENYTVGFTRELLSNLNEEEQETLSSLLENALQRVTEIVPQLSDRSRIY